MEVDSNINTRELPEFDANFSVSVPFRGGCRTIQDFREVEIIRNNYIECVTNVRDLETNQRVTLVEYKKHKDPDDELKDLLQELAIVKKLKHINILQYLEVVVQPDDLTKNFIVFENTACYLSDLMKHNIKKLHNEAKIKTIIRQLLAALSYLHDKSIMHRNIHPGTISFNDAGCLKLCNFRNAVFTWTKNKILLAQEFRYQAPEQLMMTKICDTKVDIWSTACIFAELLLRQPLFKACEREQALLDIFKLFGVPTKEIWPDYFELPEHNGVIIHGLKQTYNCMPHVFDQNGRHLEDNTMNLLLWMFTLDPKRRYTAKQCLQFRYFSEELTARSDQDVVNNITMAVLERKYHRLHKENV